MIFLFILVSFFFWGFFPLNFSECGKGLWTSVLGLSICQLVRKFFQVQLKSFRHHYLVALNSTQVAQFQQ